MVVFLINSKKAEKKADVEGKTGARLYIVSLKPCITECHESLSCADVYFVLRSQFTNSFYPKPTCSRNLLL